MGRVCRLLWRRNDVRHVVIKKKWKRFINVKHIGHKELLLCLVLLPFIFCKLTFTNIVLSLVFVCLLFCLCDKLVRFYDNAFVHHYKVLPLKTLCMAVVSLFLFSLARMRIESFVWYWREGFYCFFSYS